MSKSSKSRNSRRPPTASDKRFKNPRETTDTGPRERWQHSGRVLEFTEKAGIMRDAVISIACHDLLPAPRMMPALQKGLEILAEWYGIGAGR
jgi:hypothetical protein